MNISQREKITELYELYEFKKDVEEDDYSIYIYEQGYFNNAEIVIFNADNKEIIEKQKNSYIEGGYSVSVTMEPEYENIKKSLFNGFFKIESSNKRVINEYAEYCEIQTQRLGGIHYSYIKSQYTINGSLEGDNILDRIYNLFNENGAQLIILEAPAGFGKTCTSYEIACMLAKQNDLRIPILAELSKNRTARIFEYVLLTEIDRKFSKLSSKLVTKQIVEGNIPLIIDGFDELLSKSTTEGDNAEDARTMLDTIANLLESGSNAKILLTSRKSSIFTGDIFDDWMMKKVESCNVNRFQILAPTVADWIGHEKRTILERARIRMEIILNPVLLSMLRSTKVEEFEEKFTQESDVLESYFGLMLQREKERQQLIIDIDEQRTIMKKLAAMMVVLDISSDEPEGIKALIEDIVSPKIEDYLSLYECSDYLKPTEDEFLMKLVHNALLDRIKIGSSYIGFINEFIFGILIGEAVVSGYLSIDDVSPQYFNMMITAFSAEKEIYKRQLFEIISKSSMSLSTEQKLAIELNLVGELIYDYVDEYIEDIVFERQLNMQTDHYFYNCIFHSCTFNNIKINLNIFEGCHFINCDFYDVEIKSDSTIEEESVFLACNGHEELWKRIQNNLRKVEDTNKTKLEEIYYERLVLEQFWMPGSERAELRKSVHTLYKGIHPKERKGIMKATQLLIDENVLRKLNYCLELNTAKMAWVKTILGR